MRGPVALPGSAAYARLAPPYNGRFAGVRPAAVAQPLDARDLAAALRVARARDLAVRIRAGGHSYIGASHGRRRGRARPEAPARDQAARGRQRAGRRRAPPDRVDRGARAPRPGRRARLVPHRRRRRLHARRRLRLRCAPLRPRLRHPCGRAGRGSAHVAAGRCRRGSAAGAARGGSEPGSRDRVASCGRMPSERSRRSSRTIRGRGRPRSWRRSRRAVRRRRRRSPRSARCRPGRGRLRSRCSGSTSGWGPRLVVRLRRCCLRGRSSRRTRIPYMDAQLIFAGCLGKTLAQCRPVSEGGTLGRERLRGVCVYRPRPERRRGPETRGGCCCAAGFGWVGRVAAGCPGRGDRRRGCG